jgi:hypothetical protein
MVTLVESPMMSLVKSPMVTFVDKAPIFQRVSQSVNTKPSRSTRVNYPETTQEAGSKSANTKPSRSTISPCVMGMVRENIGPA